VTGKQWRDLYYAAITEFGKLHDCPPTEPLKQLKPRCSLCECPLCWELYLESVTKIKNTERPEVPADDGD
jgi:hypothetical protein